MAFLAGLCLTVDVEMLMKEKKRINHNYITLSGYDVSLESVWIGNNFGLSML